MGCLRTSAWDASSNFTRPCFTLSQEPKLFFQNEHFNFLSLGPTKSQFISGMFGPLPCTGDGLDLLDALKSLSRVLLLGQDLSLEVWQEVLRIVPWGL